MKTRFDYPLNSGLGPTGVQDQASNAGSNGTSQYRDICGKCGARRVDAQLGLEATPEAYVAAMVGVFAEVWRVLRDDGTVFLNVGDSYSGSVNSGGVEGRRDAGPMVRISGLAPKRGDGIKPKDRLGIPHRLVFALQAAGWYWRDEIVWAKPNPMPESVTDRTTKAHEFIFLLTKRERYWYDNEAVKEADITRPQRWISNGCDERRVPGQSPQSPGMSQRKAACLGSGRNLRSVWWIATTPYPGAHFATMSPELARRCILAGCPKGGVVLDPFAGSGTTVTVADGLNRHGIGLDLNREYLQLARQRCGRPHAPVRKRDKALPLFDDGEAPASAAGVVDTCEKGGKS